MEKIISKTVGLLLLLASFVNIANAKSINSSNGEYNAIVWVTVVTLLFAIITYIRVRNHKKINREEKAKLSKDIQ